MGLQGAAQIDAQLDEALLEVDAAVEQLAYTAAFEKVKQLIAQYPEHYIVYFKLGFVLIKMGELDPATAALEHALTLNPNAANVVLMLGGIYFSQRKLDQALACFESKVEQLQLPEIYRSIGNIYHARSNLDAAEKNYRKGLQKNPRFTDMVLDLTQLLLAKIVYQVRVQPEWVSEAFMLCDQALAHHHSTSMGRAYKLKADLFKMIDRPCEAADCYRQAIQLGFDDSATHSNLSTVLLAQGLFYEGYQECGWRWNLENYDYGNSFAPKGLTQPEWKGEVMPGRTLLVKPEQGLGDQIMLLQLLLPLVEQGMQVVFYSEQRLWSILGRSMPSITITGPNHPDKKRLLEQTDYQTYMLELIYYLKVDPNTYLGPKRYFISDPERFKPVDQRYERLALSKDINSDVNPHVNKHINRRIKVGIAWKSKSNTYGERKTVPLDLWKPIFELENLQFISIQYGDIEEDLHEAKALFGVDIFCDETIDPVKDLEGGLAQLDALDLIISVSNAGAHMAAALGKPTWLLLSCAPLWHWLHERRDSIWYPSVHLYRQKRLEDWQSVMSDVAQDLQAFADELAAEPRGEG